MIHLKYLFTLKLSRWPEETGLALRDDAPIRTALPGTSVVASKEGKALNIQQARIKVQDVEFSSVVEGAKEYLEIQKI